MDTFINSLQVKKNYPTKVLEFTVECSIFAHEENSNCHLFVFVCEGIVGSIAFRDNKSWTPYVENGERFGGIYLQTKRSK